MHSTVAYPGGFSGCPETPPPPRSTMIFFNTCGLCFALIGSLKSHLRKQTGEKPFKCDKCGLCFAQSGTLNTHLQTHAGEKPFKCDTCGLWLASNGVLMTHMRVHTGEKPFKCDTCGLCFARSGALTSHMRTHCGETRSNVTNVDFALLRVKFEDSFAHPFW